MLHLKVWLSTPYNLRRRADSNALQNTHRVGTKQHPDGCFTIQTAFRRMTYHTRRERFEPVCTRMLHCCAFRLSSSPYRLMARTYNPVATPRQTIRLQLHSSAKFDAVTG